MASGPISSDPTATLGLTTILPVVTPGSPNVNERTTLALLRTALLYGGVAEMVPQINASTYGVSSSASASTNDAGIAAAIAALPLAGGIVSLPPGRLEISAKIVLGNATSTNKSTHNGITLCGHGIGVDNTHMDVGSAIKAATELKWVGGSGGVMLEVNGPVEGVVIRDLCFNCNGLATTAIDSYRAFHQTVSNVQIVRWQGGYALRSTADRAYSGLDGGGGAPRHHLYEMVAIEDPQGTASSAHGIQVSSNTIGAATAPNCNQFHFSRVLVDRGGHDNAVGLWLGNVDHAIFTACSIGRLDAGTGKAVVVAPQSGAAQRPENIVFLATPIIGGVFHDTSAGTWSNSNNPALIFYPFFTADSQIVPPAGANSTTLPHLMVGGVTDRGTLLGVWDRTALIADSAAIANTAAETDFSKTLSVRGSVLNRAGALLRITAGGVYSTTGTPNLTLNVKLGGTTRFTATTSTDNNASAFGWSLAAEFVVRTTGASASVQCGYCSIGPGGFTAHAETPASGGQFTANLATDLAVAISVQWGAASSSNTITLQHLTAEVLQAETIS